MGTDDERPDWALSREQAWSMRGLETPEQIAARADLPVQFVLRRARQLGAAPDTRPSTILRRGAAEALRNEALNGRLAALHQIEQLCGEYSLPKSAAPSVLNTVIEAAPRSTLSKEDLIRVVLHRRRSGSKLTMEDLGNPPPAVRKTVTPPPKRRRGDEGQLARNREMAAKRFAAERAARAAAEQDPAQEVEAPPPPTPAPAPTAGVDPPEPVARMRAVLAEFAPARYPDLFQAWLDCLDLASEPPIAGDSHALWLVRKTLTNKYGLFGYPAAAAALHERARKGMPRDPDALARLITKLRPMAYGLLTDMSRSQFIFWEADTYPQLIAVRFKDVAAWLDALAEGRPAALAVEHVRVHSLQPAGLPLAKFVAAAGENMRQGRRHQPAPRQTSTARTATSGQVQVGVLGERRPMTYRPENAWLVPVRISGGEVLNDLPDWLFELAGEREAHTVREFYRRRPGTPVDAERDVLVREHVRGGGAFAPKEPLPTVTILGRS